MAIEILETALCVDDPLQPDNPMHENCRSFGTDLPVQRLLSFDRDGSTPREPITHVETLVQKLRMMSYSSIGTLLSVSAKPMVAPFAISTACRIRRLFPSRSGWPITLNPGIAGRQFSHNLSHSVCAAAETIIRNPTYSSRNITSAIVLAYHSASCFPEHELRPPIEMMRRKIERLLDIADYRFHPGEPFSNTRRHLLAKLESANSPLPPIIHKRGARQARHRSRESGYSRWRRRPFPQRIAMIESLDRRITAWKHFVPVLHEMFANAGLFNSQLWVASWAK
jgi:hypothetical protein